MIIVIFWLVYILKVMNTGARGQVRVIGRDRRFGEGI